LNYYFETFMRQKDLTGIIMAGGKSSRMGMNKATTIFRSRMLAEYPIRLLENTCGQILISTNEALPFSFKQVADVMPECGPMGGIFSCLRESVSHYNVVLACDMPLLTTDYIQALINKISDEKIIVPMHEDGSIESLCAIYPTSCKDRMYEEIKSGQFVLHAFILKLPFIGIPVPAEPANGLNIFTNINTLTELENYS